MASNQNPYGVSPNNVEAKQKVFAPQKNNGLAIASLILGLMSVVFSVFAAIPGVITGHMALSRANKFPDEYEGKGMAITGLIFSYLFLILTIILIGALMYMVMSVPGFSEEFNEAFSQGFNEGPY